MEISKKINAKKVWETTVSQLKSQLDKQTFSTFFDKSEFVKHADESFFISVPNTFTRDWLEQRMTETVIRMLNGMMDEPQRVCFVLPDQCEPEPADAALPAAVPETNAEQQAAAVLPAAPRFNDAPQHTLNPRYTFENFVVGPSNQLVFAASKAVANMPSASYNPLFIYSGVGLGKTHLAHAIGNEIVKNHEKNVLYVTSEEFTNDFIASIQRHENTAFREKYRNADVLLIDDIQFIIGKESTQEEFFHTFNTLYQMDKQIVITSDRPPKAMSTLDERMRSRFEWGLQVDIQAPDLETRMAILASKAADKGKVVPQDVQELIARQIQSNVRELEGALNRVIAVSDLCGARITRDLVMMSLGDIVPVQTGNSIDVIIRAVAGFFEVPEEKILSRDRSRDVALSRQVAMFLMRTEENLSLPQIGEALGGRDHSTVIHACEKITSLLANDLRFQARFNKLHNQLYRMGPSEVSRAI